ncbi:hypothetical protein BGZ63DRAFT_388404 [Mariannaea sp. PMI_226]|nr:hypothetical protein BGZ63DRAFT_388404 [Mariannaea sp. PMI_226]
MGDPLSVASGVAGLVSLGLSLCHGLHNYFSAIQGRAGDVTSATRRLEVLRKNIKLLDSQTGTLQSRYGSTAADALLYCLAACESELQILEALLQKLYPFRDAADAQSEENKWRNRRLAITYPFSRSDLDRMEVQVSRATAALGTFINMLILNVHHEIKDDVEALRSALQDESTTTHNMLKGLTDELEFIGPFLQRNDETISGVSTNVQELILSHHIATTMSRQTYSMMRELASKVEDMSGDVRKISSAMDEKQLSTRIQTKSQAPSSGCFAQQLQYLPSSIAPNQTHEADVRVLGCTCSIRPRHCLFQTSNECTRSMGPFTWSKRKEWHSYHHPACRQHSSYSNKSTTQNTFTFSGLRTLLSRVVAVSLTQTVEMGVYSISPSLQVYVSVDGRSSRAYMLLYKKLLGDSDLTTHITEVEASLKSLYASRESSPYEIDQYGRDIGNYVFEFAVRAFGYTTICNRDALLSIARLFEFIRGFGIEIKIDSPIAFCSDSPTKFLFLYYLAEFEEISIPSSNSPSIYHDSPFSLGYIKLLQSYPAIGEVFGLIDPLSLAILQRSETAIQNLIRNGILEKIPPKAGPLQLTAFHLSSSWLAGLRILLNESKDSSWMNLTDKLGMTPVMYALAQSMQSCNSADHWTLCTKCACTASLELLLSSDCNVYVSSLGATVLEETCSLRGRIMFLEHLLNRRQRLLDLAVSSLPLSDLTSIGMGRTTIPQAQAATVCSLLIRRGIQVPGSLRPVCDVDSRIRHDYGLYHIIECSQTADLVFSLGIREVNELDNRGFTPLACCLERTVYYNDRLHYALWLIEKGSNLDTPMGKTRLVASHIIATRLGSLTMRAASTSDIAAQVHKIILMHRPCIALPCPCTTESGPSPLSYFLIGTRQHIPACRPRLWFLEVIIRAVEVLSRLVPELDDKYLQEMVIRFCTMEELGIRHQHQLPEFPRLYPVDEKKKEIWQAVLEEDEDAINELNELVKEFDEAYARLHIPLPQFMRDHWWKRMEEVRSQHSKPLDNESKQNIKNLGVILDTESDEGTGHSDEFCRGCEFCEGPLSSSLERRNFRNWLDETYGDIDELDSTS